MILHVLDENLTYKGRLESYQSLSWKEQYQGEGGFTLIVDDTDRNAALLQHGFLLYRADRKTAMHVVNVVRSTKQRTITAGGYTELCILNRRATQNPYTVSNAEEGMRGVVTENLRGLPVEMAESQGFSDRWEGVLEEMALSDAVYSIGKNSGLGVKMLVDVNSKKRILTVYRGVDKTYSPETGGRVFSQEFGNLRELTVTEDDDLYKNVAIVRGLGQDETEKEVIIGDASGLDRREMMVRVASQGSKQTNAEYLAEMKSAGENALLKQRKVQTFEAEISPKDFGTAYDLGDLVTCNAKRYGLRFDRRITEFLHTVEKGIEKIVFTLGEPTITYAESITGKGSTVTGGAVHSSALTAYPVGSVYISSTNESPAETIGGSWELVDKEFQPQTISGDAIFTINTTNVSELSSAYCILSGHSIHIRLAIKNKVALADSTLPMGTVNFENIGVTGLPLTVFGYGASDGLNGPLYFTLNNDTGLLNHADLQGEGSTSTGQTIYYHVLQDVRPDQMIDGFCDKFYWKRKA